MNKNDLISTVADDTGLSKAEATRAVDSVFSSVKKSLTGGEEVRGGNSASRASAAARRSRRNWLSPIGGGRFWGIIIIIV